MAAVGEFEDRVAEPKSRVRRVDGAAAELERRSRGAGARSEQVREAVRDFERDLEFLQPAFARVKDTAGPPPGAA